MLYNRDLVFHIEQEIIKLEKEFINAPKIILISNLNDIGYNSLKEINDGINFLIKNGNIEYLNKNYLRRC